MTRSELIESQQAHQQTLSLQRDSFDRALTIELEQAGQVLRENAEVEFRNLDKTREALIAGNHEHFVEQERLKATCEVFSKLLKTSAKRLLRADVRVQNSLRLKGQAHHFLQRHGLKQSDDRNGVRLHNRQRRVGKAISDPQRL